MDRAQGNSMPASNAGARFHKRGKVRRGRKIVGLSEAQPAVIESQGCLLQRLFVEVTAQYAANKSRR